MQIIPFVSMNPKNLDIFLEESKNPNSYNNMSCQLRMSELIRSTKDYLKHQPCCKSIDFQHEAKI